MAALSVLVRCGCRSAHAASKGHQGADASLLRWLLSKCAGENSRFSGRAYDRRLRMPNCGHARENEQAGKAGFFDAKAARCEGMRATMPTAAYAGRASDGCG